MHKSSNNTIKCNNASNNVDGIYILQSSKNVVANNTFVNDGLFVWELYDNKIENNTVNGKPLVYLEEVSDYRVEDAGQVILVKCENITAENLDLSSTNVGIELLETCNSKIRNNTALNSRYGIYLYLSNYNTINNNNASNNEKGIYLDNSSSNIILNNNINSNNRYGIHFVSSNNNEIRNNTFVEDGLFVEHSYENIVENNVVNSKPLVYLENSSYYKITDAGQVILLNCENIIVENVNLSATSVGVLLWETNNSKINDNSVSNNFYGMYLWHSSDNKIYINNFVNNNYSVYSYKSTNIWYSTSLIQYTYNGSSYTNYMGNYWSDYSGSDADSDGIGDSPYIIDSDKDNYPLMERFENYFAPTENIFDTGAPKNPYPSISGTHNGTITPSRDITVSMLYTYPCSCTGGHSEYVKIWNESGIIAETHWNGYKGDWRNISFSAPFTLEAGKTYNYTIRTGSYPQIHHTDELEVDRGIIKCTEFVDANGKIYKDWTPAIRLW